MTNRSFAIFAAVFFAIAVVALPVKADTETHIAVAGQGEASQWPDYAIITARVRSVAESIQKASDKTKATLNNISKSIETLGIDAENFVFQSPSIEQETEYRDVGEQHVRVITGFSASQEVAIRVNDLSKVAPSVSTLIDQGGTLRQSISYFINDNDALEAKARRLAIENARQKAKDFLKDSGRSLGELQMIEESDVGYLRYEANLRLRISGEGIPRHTKPQIYADAPAPDSFRITPQPVTASTTLYVKFALED